MRTTSIVYVIVGIVFLAIIFVRFKEYTIERDFNVFSYVPCDSVFENCFRTVCADDSPDCEIIDYKKIIISAKIAPQCVYEHDCSSFSCDALENCNVVYCDDATLEEGESCTSPLNN